MKRSILLDFAGVVVLLIVTTILFRVSDLDLTLQKVFFRPGEGWIFSDLGICRFLYTYGPVPAIVLVVASLFGLIGSRWIRPIAPYRKALLFIVVLYLLGPGLVVNGIFKAHWDRPRPRDVEAFGGSRPFLPVWEKGHSGHGRSFPSGHASVGFFLFAPYFLLRQRSLKWALSFLAIGVSAGISIGIVRMVQGGHFASDVLWSGGFVYLCGIGLLALCQLSHRYSLSPSPRFYRQKIESMPTVGEHQTDSLS